MPDTELSNNNSRYFYTVKYFAHELVRNWQKQMTSTEHEEMHYTLVDFPFKYKYECLLHETVDKIPEDEPINMEKLKDELAKACSAGDLKRVRKLKELGCSVDQKIKNVDSSRHSSFSHPLFEAISSGNIVLVRYLMEEQNVDMFKAVAKEISDGRRYTRIHKYDALCHAIACKHLSPVLLEYLVHKARESNMLDKPVADYSFNAHYHDGTVVRDNLYRMTYLHYAAWVRNERACQLLVKYGSDMHRRCYTRSYITDDELPCGHSPLDLFPCLKDVVNSSSVVEIMGSKMWMHSNKLSDITILLA